MQAPQEADHEYFYPRPPRGGRHRQLATGQPLHIFLSTPSARRATCSHGCRYCFAQFLSTPSARRATIPPRCFATRQKNFYPRPPRGGRPGGFRSDHPSRGFLSTPSARRATRETRKPINHTQFLSTPSARRATANLGEQAILKKISIHALREEGDCEPWGRVAFIRYFYPRPPRGGRPRTAGRCCGRCYAISIHALREEGDSSVQTFSPSPF